ncbi:ABC transporter permease [Halorussus salilacus]|uniref:ABC transporter permease n=1 Tax=Halorussus salilacus TaxID=2953750 RepID=UPI0020A132B4|nr:ABC transporter permease [Halorussus salilacus]USZ67785.1 ABC transporter permease [Halorussus salilacus]
MGRAETTSPGDEPGERVMTPRRRAVAFAVGATALALAFGFDRFVRGEGRPLAFGVYPSGLDYLFALSWLALVTFVLAPLASRPGMTAIYWKRLKTNPWAVASLCYLAVFLVVGTVGPWVIQPDVNFAHSNQPPVFASVDSGYVTDCVGPIVDDRCQGTLQYPLGTNSSGQGVLAVLVSGMRVSLLVALVTAMVFVPIGMTIGVVAGYVGGWTDTLLMGYVDIQQTIPAFVLYIILMFVFGKSLLLVVLVFGLTSWGGSARMIRSEVLQRRGEGYIAAAENAGAGWWHVVRKHLLPNVSNTVATAMSRQIPIFILTEVAIAYLELNNLTLMSWGETIARDTQRSFPDTWWASTFAVVLLVATVTAVSVFGDAMRDVLDPKSV